jgi:predicted MFS family arabinose efflux permease
MAYSRLSLVTAFARARTRNGQSLLLVVAAGSVVTALSLGARSTFGLYLDPVVETLGTTKAQFSLAIAIQNIVWGLSQPITGAIADKYGSAKMLAVGSLGYAAALLLMSTAEGAGMLYLSAGFMTGVATGAASFSVVLSAVGRMAPPEKASMALGIVTAMGSVGQFFLVPVTRSFIDTYGWRTTISLLAVFVAMITIFTPFVRGTAISQQGEIASGGDGKAVNSLSDELRRAASSRNFLLLNGAFFVCGFHVTFIATHLVSYSEGLGVSGASAARGLALIGLFNIAGSLLAGHLGTKRSKTRLLAAIYAMRAVVILVFVLVPITNVTVVLFGAVFGTLWLSTVPLTGGIVNQQFGPTHAGTLFGIVFLSHQVGAFIGAFMGGALADRTGSYSVVWWIAFGLAIWAALLHMVLDDGPIPDPPPRTRRPLIAPAAASVLIVVGALVAVHGAASSSAGAAPAVARICILH